MRKSVAVTAATGALLFGGAGVAHATVHDVPAPSSTTTTLAAQDDPNDNGGDKTGLWGLLGLLGLAGLLGRKRDDADHRGVSTAGAGGTYRGTGTTGTDTGRV